MPDKQIFDKSYAGPITSESKEYLNNIMNAQIEQYHREVASDDEDNADIVLS